MREKVGKANRTDETRHDRFEMQLLDQRVELTSDDPVFLDRFGHCFDAPTRAPRNRPALRISVRGPSSNGSDEDALGVSTDPPDQLEEIGKVTRRAPGGLVRSIVQWGANRAERHFVFHGAAASSGRTAVILPGRTRTGKSTLALALAQHGFELLSDEFAGVRLEDRIVDPFPRSLFLREDVLEPMELPDEIGIAAGHEKTRAIRLDDLGLVRGRPAPLGLVISPAYGPRAETQLVPMRVSEAGLALFKTGCSIPNLKRRGFDWVLDLVEDVPAFQLFFSDARRAAELIAEQVLALESSAVGPSPEPLREGA